MVSKMTQGQLRAVRILDGAVNTTMIGLGYVGSALLVLYGFIYGFIGRDDNCILAIPGAIVNAFFWVGTSIVLEDYVETMKKDVEKTYHIARRSMTISAIATLVCLFWLWAVTAALCTITLVIALTILSIVSGSFTIFWAYIHHLLQEPKEGSAECQG